MTQDQNIATSIMVILIIMFSLQMFKVAFIIVYFFIFNVLPSLGRFCAKVVRQRCCMSFRTELKYSLFYLGKILKKIYTYNFYSYENKLTGFVLVTFYMIYIVFNLIFTVEYFKTDTKEEEKPDAVKYEQFIAFEFSLIIELIVCFFYITRSFKKMFASVIVSFLGLNSVIAMVVVYKMQVQLDDSEKPRRFASLIFSIYFSVLILISLVRVIKYDPNCKNYITLVEAWRSLLEEKKKYYEERENATALNVLSDEESKLCKIAEKFKLQNVYRDSQSAFFFKRSNIF